eukprot:gene3512-6987_t
MKHSVRSNVNVSKNAKSFLTSQKLGGADHIVRHTIPPDSPTMRPVTMESMCLNEPSLSDLISTSDDDQKFLRMSSLALQDYMAHIEDLLETARIDPDLKPDRTDISFLYLRKSVINCHLGRFEDSRADAQKALKIQISSLAYYRIGCSLYCLLEFDKALEYFMKAIKKDPASTYIKHAIEVVIARCRSKKDRPSMLLESTSTADNIDSDRQSLRSSYGDTTDSQQSQSLSQQSPGKMTVTSSTPYRRESFSTTF